MSTIWYVSPGSAEQGCNIRDRNCNSLCSSMPHVRCPPCICEQLFSSWIMGCWMQSVWYRCCCFVFQYPTPKISLTFMHRCAEIGEPSRGSSLTCSLTRKPGCPVNSCRTSSSGFLFAVSADQLLHKLLGYFSFVAIIIWLPWCYLSPADEN